jgi:hypothetical protein
MAQLEEEEYFLAPLQVFFAHQHNLDVMHIEKNICESILGTLLKLMANVRTGRMLGLTWSIYGYDQINTL